MRLPRHSFIDQFWPAFQVHCLPLWRQGSKEPPDHLPRAVFEWIKTSNGQICVDLPEFRAIVWPIIVELHQKHKGARPDAQELAGAVYDALSAAAVEVTIGESKRQRGS
jgi:hypothetical protein